MRSVFRAVDGNFDKIKANAKDLQHSSEGLELSQRAAVDRILGDLVRPVKVGKIEKTADAFEDLFYKFNGLSLITAVGKFVDSAIRIPKFYKQIKNYILWTGLYLKFSSLLLKLEVLLKHQQYWIWANHQ